MPNENKPASRKLNIVVQEFAREILIYDLKINKAFCLNETSALVYQLADGKNSVGEISDLMSQKLKTLVSEDLIYLALDGMKKQNLLENGDELTIHFAGLSRRDVIKKVGLASMITLPVISSLVAPTAANAQSGANCQTCTSNAQCASGKCRASITASGKICSAASNPSNAYPSSQVFGSLDCADTGSKLCCSGSASQVRPGICRCAA